MTPLDARPAPRAPGTHAAHGMAALVALGRSALLGLLATALLLGGGPAAQAQQAAKGKPAPAKHRESRSSDVENIEMNFKNVNMDNFLTIMSKALDIPLVWDESRVRGNITLVSPKKFNRKDALSIFQTVLAMHNFTTVHSPNSPVVEVVPSAEAPRMPSPTRTTPKGPASRYFVTQIIPLKYADANQVRAAIIPLMSKSAGLAVYSPGNVLVLSDTEANVHRMLAIIKEMDVPSANVDFAVIPLKHASAAKLAPLLTTLSTALPAEPGQPGQRGRPGARGAELKAVADERTNTLILVGDPRLLEKFRGIIATLDVPGAVQESGVRVFHLQYADATELVKILKNVNLREEPKGNAPRQAQAARGALAGLTMTADKPTNTLIVFGPTDLMNTMAEMVKELDVRRPQVFVEVLIMEMSLNKSLQLGVRWQATGPVKNGAGGVGFPDATPTTLQNALSNGQGSALGIVGNEITFAGQKFTSFSGFVKATQQDQDLNVLANPQLLTLNNQQAEINVSEVVPISTTTVTNQTLQTTTEYQFKDVGIILKITPQITGNNKVRLNIDQESSSIASAQDVQNINSQAVTTLKRKLTTQVVVDDGTTMAIGGLIQNQDVKSENKIPCLGDIPIVGWLFKTVNNQTRKTNLIIFIKPHIILSPDDLRAQTVRSQRQFDTVRNPKTDTESVLRRNFGLPAKSAPSGTEKESPGIKGGDSGTGAGSSGQAPRNGKQAPGSAQ